MLPRLLPTTTVPQAVSLAHCASSTQSSMPVPAPTFCAVARYVPANAPGVIPEPPPRAHYPRLLPYTGRQNATSGPGREDPAEAFRERVGVDPGMNQEVAH